MIPFNPKFAAGMDGEVQVPGYVNDAHEGLLNNERCDSCLPSHAVDFALAIVFKNATSLTAVVADLDYAIAQLQVVLGNVKRELPERPQ
jgi:hypothetical protein